MVTLTEEQAQEIADELKEFLGSDWTFVVRDTPYGFQARAEYWKDGVDQCVTASDWCTPDGRRQYTATLGHTWEQGAKWAEHGDTAQEALEKTRASALLSIQQDARLLGMKVVPNTTSDS